MKREVIVQALCTTNSLNLFIVHFRLLMTTVKNIIDNVV